MSKEDKAKDVLAGLDTSRVEKVDTPAPLTVEFLLQLLVNTQKEQAAAYDRLADALLESRKPYVDPKVLAAKKQELEERQKMIAIEQNRRAANKKYCPHKRENGTWNIKWQEHSGGIILGVCGTCNSQFDARNAEDAALLRQDLKSIKNMGRAGSHARKAEMASAV